MSDFTNFAGDFSKSQQSCERRPAREYSKDANRVPLMDISNSGANIQSIPADYNPIHHLNSSIDHSSEQRDISAGLVSSQILDQVNTNLNHL